MTRLGEILPLWQNFNFWARFEGLLAVEKFGKSNIEWQNLFVENGQILKKSSHMVTLKRTPNE